MTHTESAGYVSAGDDRKHVWEWGRHMRQAMGSACRQLQQIGIAQNTQYICTMDIPTEISNMR